MANDKVLQSGTSPAYQYCVGIDKERRIFIKCSDGIGEAISHLQTPGLPLCARSRTDWKTDSGPGYKDCFYGEVIQESDQGTSKICKEHRAKFERDRNPSAGSLSAKRSEAWLRGEDALEKSSWNTAMTDCGWKRSYKLIGFWFLKRPGNRVM